MKLPQWAVAQWALVAALAVSGACSSVAAYCAQQELGRKIDATRAQLEALEREHKREWAEIERRVAASEAARRDGGR